MSPVDYARLALGAMRGHRVRTVLMLIAMAIGVAAVVVLTALGEGARRFVSNEFAALGTNLLIVLPGRSETKGGHPPILGETPRDLTIDDALALTRDRNIRRVAPISVGNVEISFRARERETMIIGTTSDYLPIRQLRMGRGRFIETPDPRRSSAECVVGTTVLKELFGSEPALGEWLRLGDRRCRVIGVLGTEEHTLGVSMDEVVLVPVAFAMSLFNTDSLFRVMAEASSRETIEDAKAAVSQIIRTRHDGEDDVTVIAQDAILATFDRILRTLTFAVAGIAGISLAVAGILIMNVMLIAVAQRTAEVGLLKAVGAPPGQITRLFLAEAAALALSGAMFGLLLGEIAAWLLARLYPAVPIHAPLWAVVAAVAVALTTGVVFGILPARQAARLDPVVALARR